MFKLLEVIQDPSFKDVGFIIGLKMMDSTEPVHDKMAKMTMPNLKVADFIPQKLLLNEDKVKMFVTHCGANSIHESFYFNGTPMW
eukprot:CAMPEP_0176373792 /NCGR_PEP_ID=MMETSP0126-20121128/26302_1 /TAXON_ID=141414 ORGANISM="Strombidinopsis acuminatum, Strain SPMC142" /NCGR_SAMPLE_ID=MMETSP0126 /ASSEMBLY_ACC=CAM_ASM_000229 /LENGTH=84 /DNA_ID=CAMNT_0017734103 /DNA_START=881 /DNA_END=1132 /DNA_ORIENTATION=-